MDALMSMRIGSPPVGMPTASGFGGEDRRAAAERGHAGERRIGTGDDHHQPAIRGAFQKRREAADVMAAADHHCSRAELLGAFRGCVHGLGREPDAGKLLAIPRRHRAAIRDHFRFAGRRHRSGRKFEQVGRRELQSVRGVAEQISFDQTLGDGRGLVAVAPRGSEKGRCKINECSGVITGFRHRSALAIRFTSVRHRYTRRSPHHHRRSRRS